mmetsp:Transcript_112493/g.350593  ORF Transcript_112493/g.350593 Transcript_112493/m.350593 type:complete len:326 (+) Transcript_112493:47-1024(+)|eukprot:CAMPEP_0204584620 /NCGR_PEP_ID=MMETSP0661-20131031/46442_1 /ASSEMBLY_ACC=CAM_ASM_000606 /TAXON_ID=109239 /ORGANISM="Alexandrium margalefi, Strain AMGDE01CS-322" /LENGTH=325 /DNA_ID=CAMNT_0051594089 /DNA_START=45 /DNA_END=1022 /DNA_ORIENTATION=+
MTCRSISAVFLAFVALAGAAAFVPDDALAMVQQGHHAGRAAELGPPPRPALTIAEALEAFKSTTPLPDLPAQTEFEEGMRMWLKAYWGLLRAKGDMTFLRCCELVKQYEIVPHETWGTASLEDQQWWEDTNCNILVGADNPDEPAGAPLCPQANELTKMLPPEDPDPFAAVALEIQDGQGVGREGPGCDEEDRQELNASYTDRSKLLSMSDHCQEFYLIKNGVQWDKMVPCASELHGVTHACSRCHSNLLMAIAGQNSEEQRGCFMKCMGLGACRVVSDCGWFIDQCAECVQPSLKDYHRCIGGPIYNPLTLQRLFEGMFLYRSA